MAHTEFNSDLSGMLANEARPRVGALQPQWENELLIIGCWVIRPAPLAFIETPIWASSDDNRKCLDGLLWPRRLEEPILQLLEPEWNDAGEGPRDRRAERHGTATFKGDDPVTALEFFHGALSGPILDQLYIWPQIRGVLPLYITLERFPSFSRLWDAHPQLAWLTAQRLFELSLLTAESHAAVANLLGQGPRELIRWLGLPPRAATLRLLRRFRLWHLESLLDHLKYLPSLLSCEPWVQFSAQVDPDFLPCLLDLLETGPLPAPSILAALQEIHSQWPDDWQQVRLRIREWQERPTTPQGHPLSRITSLQRFWGESWPDNQSPIPDAAFVLPKPPFPGEETPACRISSIPTVGDLVRLSRRLRNCVERACLGLARGGDIAFYKVESKGDLPCLLSLRRRSEGWCLFQCLGPNNSRPSGRIDKAVKTWLETNLIPVA